MISADQTSQTLVAFISADLPAGIHH
jgi:hypothetical protein